MSAMRELRIRCSVVGLAAEVRVTRALAEETGGDHGVALNHAHLQTLVMAQLQVPTSPRA